MKTLNRPIRSILALFLVVLFLLPMAPMAEAVSAAEITVVLDGTPVEFDVQPQLVSGRVLVPVRFIAEELGAEVDWDASTRTVTIEANDDVIILTIGSSDFTINGETQQMDVAPRLSGGRTLVPVRFIAEALDKCVDWLHPIRTVAINTADERRALPLYDMTFPLTVDGIRVHEFVLEDGTLTTWNDMPVPAPMEGIISLPNFPTPRPLVVLLHGVTRIESIHDPVYAGFDYLVQQLAREGYVAVSINVNVEYTLDYGESIWGGWGYDLFNQHLERLKAANDGEDMGYGIDLTNTIDFDQIHLIGHSRGGELADIIYRRDRIEGISRISSIIRIAPTVLRYDWEDPEFDPPLGVGPHPSIPVGIILPEFDGDVRELEGQSVFDDVLASGESDSILSLVFLRGANHNFFNRFMERDEGTSQVNRLTRAEQEEFMMHYAASFLALVSGNRAPWGAFAASYAQPQTMFGFHVIASTYIPAPQAVIAVPSAATAAAVTTSGGASAGFHMQIPNEDGHFNHPGVSSDKPLALYDLQWSRNGGAATFPLLDGNFSNHHALSLYIAVDSSNAQNPEGQDQAITVILRDTAGESRSITIPRGTAALTWNPGELEQNEWSDYPHWVGHMPLGELRIPLALFGGMDLRNIAELTISFDQTNTGAVMLSGIYLT